MKQKNIVIQRDIKDCGVSCLASIISHYNGYAPIEYLRQITLTNKDGTTAFHLINASKELGFDAYGIKINNINEIKVLPCIAHINLNNNLKHFVVIYNISKDKITIMDPAKGKVKLKIKDFEKLWSKVILVMYPKTNIIKLNKELNIFSLLNNTLKVNKKVISAIIISSLIITLISIILNFYYEIAIDIISFNNLNSLYNIIIIFLLITIFKIIISYLREYFEVYLSKNIDYSLYKEFITHTLLIPLNITKTRSSGEIITRISELEIIKSLITDIILTTLLDLVLAICAAFLLYNISPNLFITLMIIIIIYIILSIILSKLLYPKILNAIQVETTFNNQVLESIDNIESIKNTNYVNKYIKIMNNNIINYLKNNFNLTKFINIQNIIKISITDIGMFIINSYAFILIFNNQLELVNLMTFNAFLLYLWTPIKNSVDMIPKYNYIKATLTKLSDYLSINKEKLMSSNQKLSGSISFQNIHYAPNKLNLLINNFSCEMKSNSKVLISGSSGSGKSSICKMLYKTINPDQGSISIGGVNITDISLYDLRNTIVYNSQSETLFTDTLYNNLTLHNNISIKKINEVLNLCELNNIIDKLPLRLETTINKDANNFSGGEAQRIILARTLLLNRNVIILDESLSEVSQIQEERILKNIFNKYKNKLIITISHKKINLKFDQIINLGTNE